MTTKSKKTERDMMIKQAEEKNTTIEIKRRKIRTKIKSRRRKRCGSERKRKVKQKEDDQI